MSTLYEKLSKLSPEKAEESILEMARFDVNNFDLEGIPMTVDNFADRYREKLEAYKADNTLLAESV